VAVRCASTNDRPRTHPPSIAAVAPPPPKAEPPPGGACRRVVGRSEIKLPLFWLAPLANALLPCELAVWPPNATWLAAAPWA
jgi:hypothetical protein